LNKQMENWTCGSFCSKWVTLERFTIRRQQQKSR